MKLLTRGTLMFIGVTVFAFAGGGWLFYKFLSDLVIEEAEERLRGKEKLILATLRKDSALTSSPFAPEVSIQPANAAFEEHRVDTFIYNEYMGELVPYRLLTFHYTRDNAHYAISIREPLLEEEDLVEGVFISFIIVLIALGTVIVIGMQVLSRNIWSPFLSTLKVIEEFRPGSNKEIRLPDTGIKEFNQLNVAIEKMVHNTEAAFISIRSFSENAAHEIQTPLAIIQSTTEVLLQDESLSEYQHRTIAQLSSTTARLSNIVSTLLLLTRIENRQFLQETPINFASIVRDKMFLFRELFEQRGIFPQLKIEDDVQVKLHRVLAEILVSNLLVNAVRHTVQNGKAEVLLNKKEFTVRNSGQPLRGDSTRIFERFYKEDQSELSTGLGLSLVKMVTDAGGFHVAYHYENGMHVFSVQF